MGPPMQSASWKNSNIVKRLTNGGGSREGEGSSISFLHTLPHPPIIVDSIKVGRRDVFERSRETCQALSLKAALLRYYVVG